MYGVTRKGDVAEFKPGDRVVWYDPRLWGPRDIGNNDHCRKPGTVVGIGRDALGQTIDILFDHNPNVSHGHFAYHPYLDTEPSHAKETA